MSTTYDDGKNGKLHDRGAVDGEALDSDFESTGEVIQALVAEDHGHDIKLRTMSWQRAAWLLAGDQVCLAIMAQSWSLSYALPSSLYIPIAFQLTMLAASSAGYPA